MARHFLALILGVFLFAFSCLFIVSESERGIVIQFGKVKRTKEGMPVIYHPGIHLKVPFIDSVRKLDARMQTLDGQPDRFVTSEKKDLIIDSYVKWRIEDFAKFYLATGGGDMAQAENLLRKPVNNGLRSEIGERTIGEVVSGERDEIMAEVLASLSETNKQFGIQVLDVRTKQINLVEEISKSIYARMVAERSAVAKEHRAQGEEKATIIRANVDKEAAIMISEARSRAREMVGEGNAQAAAIYAKSYRKNPEFYEFIRSLEAYQTSFASGENFLVLKPDSEFFRYFRASK